MEEHTCGCSGLDVPHCSEPGAHVPEQTPATHAWLTHAVAVPQLPVASQVCAAFAEQRCAPGLHTPVQAPPLHAWLVHATAAPQAPVKSHVSTALPEHRVAPGLHATQPPARHTGAPPLQADGAPHCPFALHVSTPPPDPASPVHTEAPGGHTPVHAPPLHT